MAQRVSVVGCVLVGFQIQLQNVGYKEKPAFMDKGACILVGENVFVDMDIHIYPFKEFPLEVSSLNF